MNSYSHASDNLINVPVREQNSIVHKCKNICISCHEEQKERERSFFFIYTTLVFRLVVLTPYVVFFSNLVHFQRVQS